MRRIDAASDEHVLISGFVGAGGAGLGRLCQGFVSVCSAAIAVLNPGNRAVVLVFACITFQFAVCLGGVLSKPWGPP